MGSFPWKKNEWLVAEDGKLACSICRTVKSLGPNRVTNGQKQQLSKEWIHGTVNPYGDTHDKQLRSIRKKIFEHNNSKGHSDAEKVVTVARTDSLKEAVIEQEKEHVRSTANVFRTAYYIAKNDRPYLDHPELIDLQRANGVNVGRVLHSQTVCVEIIDHIATGMRKKLIDPIISAKKPISILIDESTSLGQKACLVIYLRCCVGDSCQPISFFLDIVSLCDASADGILEQLLNCLYKNGLNKQLLQEFWLGLGTDGASVMTGRKGGLCVKLKKTFPNLISWHCFNHRLELSVHDAIKSCTEINHLKIFMDKLYTTYSMSPKNRVALERCASEIGSEPNKIGRVLDVRWVASSFRAVNAVWISYGALHEHSSPQSINYNDLDSKERATYSGLRSKLESPVFLKNLALMSDALEELSDLSECLQADSMDLPKAQRLISRQIEVFQARKSSNGKKYMQAEEAIKNKLFKNVPLGIATQREKNIDRGQFYQALTDSLAARMLPQTEQSYLESLKAILPEQWPELLSPEYGESELKIVSSKFLVPYGSSLKDAYRDFKDSKSSVITPPMQALLSAIGTLPVSTAACERGFSKMNVVCSPLRSKLTVGHMSSLMFISIVGPPVLEWKPTSYVHSWIAKGRRNANSHECALCATCLCRLKIVNCGCTA